MPAKSPAQRRLFGMVAAYKAGKLSNPSDEIKKVASGVSSQAASDFASLVQPSVKKKRMALASSLVG